LKEPQKFHRLVLVDYSFITIKGEKKKIGDATGYAFLAF